jgi:hypothetical protein
LRLVSNATDRERVFAMRLRQVIVSAAAVLSASLLVACTADEPSAGVTPTPSPSGTELPGTPTSEPSAETAKEFIRRWNDEETRMQSGDSAAYRRSSRECPRCLEFADKVDGYYEAGGYVRTAGRKVLWVRRTERPARGIAVYRYAYESAPTRYRTSAEEPIQKLDGGRSVDEVTLRREGTEWVVMDKWTVR